MKWWCKWVVAAKRWWNGDGSGSWLQRGDEMVMEVGHCCKEVMKWRRKWVMAAKRWWNGDEVGHASTRTFCWHWLLVDVMVGLMTQKKRQFMLWNAHKLTKNSRMNSGLCASVSTLPSCSCCFGLTQKQQAHRVKLSVSAETHKSGCA